MKGFWLGLVLLSVAASAAAQPASGDLSDLLPASGEFSGLTEWLRG